MPKFSETRTDSPVHTGPGVTSGAAEAYEALRGFGPSLLSVVDAMRRSRECRVRTAGTKGAEPAAPQAPHKLTLWSSSSRFC